MNVNRTLGLLLMVAIVAVTALVTPALADVNLIADRTVPVTDVAPGDTFTVTVDLECTGTDDYFVGMGLEETIPFGWTVTENQSAGYAFSVIGDTASWIASGPELHPGDIHTITYDVTVNSLEIAGLKTISGSASAYTFVGEAYVETPIADDTVNVVVTHDPIIHITTLDSLQDTIDNAQEGDTIMMAPGTYTFPGDWMEAYLFIPKTLTFMADEGEGEVIISTNGNSMNNVIKIGVDHGFVDADASGTTFRGISFIGAMGPYSVDPLQLDVYNPGMTYEDCSFIGNVGTGDGASIKNDTVFRNCDFEALSDGHDGYILPEIGVEGNNILMENCSGDLGRLEGSASNLIVRDNNFSYGRFTVDATDSLFENNYLSSGQFYLNNGNSNNIIRNNEMLSLSECVLSGQVYLNNFIDVTVPITSATGSVFNTSEEVTYTYRGASCTGYLGNYYSDYAGNDADGNGVGEDAFGSDTYPLMGAWIAADSEIESSLVILWQGEVTLMNDNTLDASLVDPAAPSSWDTLTDLGALMETDLAIDAAYSPASDPYPASFWINDIGAVNGTGWGLLINGELAPYGTGANHLNDGDVVEFYSPLWTLNETGTYVASADGANYGVIITVNDDSPVEAIRTIATQTFMQDEVITTDQHNSTLVTIEFEALKDIEALTVIEEVPAGWILTPADNDGSSFRACPDAADTYEWVWADDMLVGNTTTISYIVQIPYNESAATYDFTGFVSAMVNAVDVNGINVDGDDFVVIEEDWNPWDDIDSVADENVVTSELQQAINCWLTDEPAPVTGARITTDRLQEVISQWLASTE
ncbi:hypothetical protein [Methanococcoides sp. NM1]|uniref:hypothetical protein n=1 Tax=Methanococcoides sp. NM1 TaxID=1201013 RepID=UPI0010832B35|nr:hypothetical protein [Methanococcoides sp. NM1]